MNLRKKTFLISLVFGTINIAILIFIFWYLFPAIKKVSRELNITELSFFSVDDEQSKQVKNTYEKMKQGFERTEGLFANPITPLELINSWEKIAEEEGLIIKISPTPLEEYKNDPWDFLGFEIVLSGDFVNIQKFIEKIENSKYLFEVNNSIIKKNTKNQKLEEATAIMLLKTYINKNAGQD